MAPSHEANGLPKLSARLLDIAVGGPEVFLRPEDATAIGVRPMDRVRVRSPQTGAEFPAVVNVAEGIILPGSIGLSSELAARIQIPAAALLEVRPAPRPASIALIRRKLDGAELSAADIATVIADIAGGHLTPIELTCWATGIYTRGLSLDETVACVQAMVDTGERIDWEGGEPRYDVHSIGGVPGNKYAPIVVAIAAAAGLKVPKTSSRAISSACGTADFMEVLTPVALTTARLRAVTNEVGGTLAWGGGFALAPADDEIIRVEYPLGLDPPAQVVASVLAKKLAMGVSKVLIDLPMGLGAKVPDARQADALATLFHDVGARLGIDVQCEVTKGARIVGHAIGPVLEAQEALALLEKGTGAPALAQKCRLLAGRLLEMGGKAPVGKGGELAARLLADGSALAKFRAILQAQGGKSDVRWQDLVAGPHAFDALSLRDGPFELDNAAAVGIARAAGAPHAKGAGLRLLHDLGAPVKAGEPVFRVFSETPSRLANAWDATQQLNAFQCRQRP